MRKLIPILLGLGLVLGSASAFTDDLPKSEKKSSSKVKAKDKNGKNTAKKDEHKDKKRA
jgi:hypothetical protein